MADLSPQLRRLTFDLGGALFGVGRLQGIKEQFDLSSGVLKNLTRGISIAVRLSDKVLEEIEDRPTKLYYHHYRPYASRKRDSTPYLSPLLRCSIGPGREDISPTKRSQGRPASVGLAGTISW